MRLHGASASTAKTWKWFTLCIISVGLAGPWVSALPVKNADSLENTPSAGESFAPPTQAVVPTSIERPDDAEPCAASDDQGTSPDAFLYSDTMRRLIGDLATCRDDLFTLRVGEASLLHSNDRVVVNKSHWRSCREALFTLIRWIEEKRSERTRPKCATESPTMTIPPSRARRAYPPPMAQKTWQMETQVAEQNIDMESTYRARCKKQVCDFPNLLEYCSQDKKRMSHWDSRFCAMCYPPNAKLIEQHCAGKTRSEGDVYLFLIGLLLTLVGAAATLVWLRDWREKRRITKFEGDILGEPSRTRKGLNMQKSNWRKYDPRELEFVAKISQHFRNKPTVDLEDTAQGIASANIWTSQPLTAGVTGPTTQRKAQKLYHRMPLPVMTKALSSGIQTPIGAAAAAYGSLHQRFASADGVETVPRDPLFIPLRSSSSRQFGSSP